MDVLTELNAMEGKIKYLTERLSYSHYTPELKAELQKELDHVTAIHKSYVSYIINTYGGNNDINS